MFVGNLNLTQELKNNKEISHAYIFAGPEGIGKKTLAICYARKILTGKFKLDTDGFAHPDLFILEKERVKKADIEELIEDSYKLPFEGKRKVYIIDGFEEATKESQNAFLKTLEEPPEYLTIFLITSDLERILDTILSRCRTLNFNGLSQNEIEEFLIDKGIRKNARLFSKISGGSLKKAIALNQGENFERRQKTIKNLLKILKGSKEEIFKQYNFFEENKDDLQEIFETLSLFLRDLAVYKSTKNVNNILNIDYIEEIKGLNLSTKEALEAYKILEKARNNFKSNLNFRLNIENMLMKLGGLNDWRIRSKI